ncbi:hypothetical protein LINGRAHAP2_LOCUS13197, partial [Linum grandiflorum]
LSAEAKGTCVDSWDCDGGQRCLADCQKKYKGGIGLCNPPISPFAPVQCICSYNC